MTAITIEGRTYVPESRFRRARRALAASVVAGAGRVAQAIPRVAKANARLSLSHLKDHAYTILGFGSLTSAAFYHSVFTGLIVLGVSFFLYELKVSD